MSPPIHYLFFPILIINSYASRCDDHLSKFKPSEMVEICGSNQRRHPTQDNRLNVKLVKYMGESEPSNFSFDTETFSVYSNVHTVDISCLSIDSINVERWIFCKNIFEHVVNFNAV